MKNLEEIAEDTTLLEIGRQAIENTLVELRDGRIGRICNNGLVIKESDGSNSHIIRMRPDDALRIGLRAIAKHLKEN